jgi:hypothetical protein
MMTGALPPSSETTYQLIIQRERSRERRTKNDRLDVLPAGSCDDRSDASRSCNGMSEVENGETLCIPVKLTLPTAGWAMICSTT